MTAYDRGVEAGDAPIVQYWHSNDVPDDVAALIATFRDQNPGTRHVLFDRETAEQLIEERFGPREIEAFRACREPSVQSDYLRYCAGLALGGVYADADMRCVAPLEDVLRLNAGGTLFGWAEMPPAFQTREYEWRERVGPYRVIPSGFFAFGAPGHPLLELALEIATRNIETRLAGNAGVVTGPGVLTCLYFMRELGSLRAFTEYVRGGAFEALAPNACAAVEDDARIEAAFADVGIPPMKVARAWIGPSGPLSYKRTEAYWRNSKRSIFHQRAR